MGKREWKGGRAQLSCLHCRFQPGRAKANRPAFQRWDTGPRRSRVPSGTAEWQFRRPGDLSSLTGLFPSARLQLFRPAGLKSACRKLRCARGWPAPPGDVGSGLPGGCCGIAASAWSVISPQPLLVNGNFFLRPSRLGGLAERHKAAETRWTQRFTVPTQRLVLAVSLPERPAAQRVAGMILRRCCKGCSSRRLGQRPVIFLAS